MYVPADTSLDNDDVAFVNTVAHLLSVEVLRVPVEEKDSEDILENSHNGRLPLLLLEDGTTYISEPLSIARWFSNNKQGFYGPDLI